MAFLEFRRKKARPGPSRRFGFHLRWSKGSVGKTARSWGGVRAVRLDACGYAGLKELAGLKSLQSLNLGGTQGDGRGAEGTGRAQELAIAEPWQHAR